MRIYNIYKNTLHRRTYKLIHYQYMYGKKFRYFCHFCGPRKGCNKFKRKRNPFKNWKFKSKNKKQYYERATYLI